MKAKDAAAILQSGPMDGLALYRRLGLMVHDEIDEKIKLRCPKKVSFTTALDVVEEVARWAKLVGERASLNPMIVEAVIKAERRAINKMFGMRLELKEDKNEVQLSDKPICPHGVKARFCPHHETLYDTRKTPIPTSVEQLQFYCNADPEKCDWKGATNG